MKFKLMPKQRRLAALTASGEEGSSDKIYNLPAEDFSNYAEFFEMNQLEELVIEEKGTRILFRKRATPVQADLPLPQQTLTSLDEASAFSAEAQPSEAATPTADSSVTKVLSPLNGSFYASASPDSPPFVSIGTQVSPGTVLCMVEAMKIFNELKAETSGKIVKILVQNAEAVKEGQELFWIE